MPNGWILAKVKDITFTASGGTPSTGKKEYWENGNIPWINSGTLKDCIISKPSHYITELGLKNSSAKLFPKNSVVIALTGATTGKVGILDFECSANQSVTALYPSDNHCSKYLFYFLLGSRDEIVAMSLGSAQPHINKFIVDNLTIPLPPLPEQHRIVAKLDALFEKIEANKRRLEKIPQILKRFRQSVLADAVSGKLTERWREENGIFDEWELHPLGKLTSKLIYGSSKKSDAKGKVPVLRMGNIQDGIIKWDDLKFSSDESEIEKYKLEDGDVLFNRTNSPELVGKTAIYRNEQPAIYAGYLIKIKTNKRLNPEYLNLCLNSLNAREWCHDVKTDGVSQSNINAKKLAGFIIETPSIFEQNEIVIRVEQLFAFADTLESRYAKARAMLDKLPQSILGKAFRGELLGERTNPEDFQP